MGGPRLPPDIVSKGGTYEENIVTYGIRAYRNVIVARASARPTGFPRKPPGPRSSSEGAVEPRCGHARRQGARQNRRSDLRHGEWQDIVSGDGFERRR